MSNPRLSAPIGFALPGAPLRRPWHPPLSPLSEGRYSELSELESAMMSREKRSLTEKVGGCEGSPAKNSEKVVSNPIDDNFGVLAFQQAA